jgi:L-ascorbate metabolism protein UlaG (beta-lactamase superfamily)
MYVDPYLTDYVADRYGEALRRLIPPPCAAHQVTDADWVLVTHAHEDHADPTSLGPLAVASPQARFVCPPPVVGILLEAGIDRSRIERAPSHWLPLTAQVAIRAVPAAHLAIERDENGAPSCVGYLIRAYDRVVYHSGDTIPHPDVIAAVRAEGPIASAFLPVNERNYYRAVQGIIGNMSVREAVQFARDIQARELIPVHWDLFAPNSTPKPEIRLVHELMGGTPALRFCESGLTETL